MGDIVKFAERHGRRARHQAQGRADPARQSRPLPSVRSRHRREPQGLLVLVTRGPGLWVRDLEVQGRQAAANRGRARADQDRPHREGRDRLQGTLGQELPRRAWHCSRSDEGKWRVEFDEPWAKEGAKPPEAPRREEPPGADRRGAARSGSSSPPSGRSVPAVGGARHHRSAMPLTLVLGPANSAKAGEVLGAYAPASQRGALLVVPTAPDAAHYARELAADGVGARVGAHVRRAWRARSRGGRATADDGCRRSSASAWSAGRSSRELRFQALERVRAGAGLRAAAGDLIAELQRALVTPQRFAAAMRAWAARGRAARRRTREDVAAHLPRRTPASSRRRARRPRAVRVAGARRAARRRRARGAHDPVFLYGFDDLHPLERDAVETLARVVGAPSDGVADLRAGARGAGRPGRGRGGAAAAAPAGARAARARRALRAAARAPRCTTSSAAVRAGPPRMRVDPGTRGAAARGGRRARRGRARRRRGARAAARGACPATRSPSSTARRDRGAADRARVRAVRDRGRASTRRVPFGHTAAGPRAARRWRAARCWRPGAARERPAGLSAHARAARAARGRRRARGRACAAQGLRTAARRASGSGWALGELDALRRGRGPGGGARAARRAGCWPRRTAGGAGGSSTARSSTRARWRRCSTALSRARRARRARRRAPS